MSSARPLREVRSINVSLRAADDEALNKLVAYFGAATDSEAIRRAMRLTHQFVLLQDPGCRIMIKYPDGEEIEVRFI